MLHQVIPMPHWPPRHVGLFFFVLPTLASPGIFGRARSNFRKAKSPAVSEEIAGLFVCSDQGVLEEREGVEPSYTIF
jgi:hypothetical protein